MKYILFLAFVCIFAIFCQGRKPVIKKIPLSLTPVGHVDLDKDLKIAPEGLKDQFKALIARGPKISNFVINGVDAKKNSKPYMVSLQVQVGEDWYHICGGSLISQTKVLTAAHCLDYKDIVPHRAAIGFHSLSEGVESTGAQAKEVVKFDLHEDYDNPASDMAVLTLDSPVELTEFVQIIEMASYFHDWKYSNTSCVISGWGNDDNEGGSPDILQTANFTRLGELQCASFFKALDVPFLHEYVCLHEYGQNGCYGDSGGPVVCGSNPPRVVGVASFLFYECNGCYPTIYSRAAYFLWWVKSKM